MSIKRYSKSIKLDSSSKISEITLRLRKNRWNSNYSSIEILFWNCRKEMDVRRRTDRLMAISNDGLHFDYIYEWNANDLGVDYSHTYPQHLIRDGIDFEWEV